MKSILKAGAAALAALFLAVPAFASINANAPSTSHALENAATALHDYMHDNYTSSYGAHGLEVAADALHTLLHDWANGNATEADVDAAVQVTNDAFSSMMQSFQANGILADNGARRLTQDAGRLLIKVNALTN